MYRGGAREAEGRELLAPAVRLEHRRGHRVHVGRVEEHGGVAGDLRDRARVRRGDGTSARHRLEDRQPEALVQARIDEARRAAVQRGEVLGRDGAEVLDAFGERLEPVEAASGEDEPELRPRLAQRRERLEEPRVILVRPRPRGVEEDRLGLVVAEPEDRVVDRVRDDVHAARVEIQQLDGAPAHELARHDDRGRATRRPVVGDAPERPARRAEELGKVAMLRVVQRDDGRRLRSRRGDGQRVVEDVELGDLRRHRLRAARGERHRRDAERPAAADGRILDLDGGQAFGRILRARRHEHHVLVRPDARRAHA